MSRMLTTVVASVARWRRSCGCVRARVLGAGNLMPAHRRRLKSSTNRAGIANNRDAKPDPKVIVQQKGAVPRRAADEPDGFDGVVRHVQQPAAGLPDPDDWPLQPGLGIARRFAILLVSVQPARLRDVLAVNRRSREPLLTFILPAVSRNGAAAKAQIRAFDWHLAPCKIKGWPVARNAAASSI